MLKLERAASKIKKQNLLEKKGKEKYTSILHN